MHKKRIYKIIFILLFITVSMLSAQKSLKEHDSFKTGLKKVEVPEKPQQEVITKEEKPIIETTIPPKQETKKEPVLEDFDTLLLGENMLSTIENINVKDVELRDLLRGIAYQYKVNLVVDNHLKQPISLTLTNVKVIDLIRFLRSEYKLEITQQGSILRISEKKQKIEQETPSKDKMFIEIKAEKIDLDIENGNLKDVAKELSRQSGINFVLKHGVQGKVTGYLNNVEWLQGITLLLSNNNFSLRERDDIFYIDYDRRTYSGEGGKDGSLWVSVSEEGLISFDLIDTEIMHVIKELSHQLNINLVTYETPNRKISAKCANLSLKDALNILFKGTEFTFKQEDDVYIIGNKKISGLSTSKLIRLKHIRSEGIPELLPESIQRQATIKIIKEQNAIMVIATNDIIAELEEFLNQIDSPTPQILIEALVVDFNSSDMRELGVLIGTNKSQADTSEWSNFSFLDLGINEDGKLYAQHDGGSLNPHLSKFSNWAGMQNIGVLPENFYVKIQALETEGKANVRSRPQIATLNGHTASISIGTTQYYILKTTTPVGSQENIVTQESERFEKVEANVTLAITPWVSASGEVTAEIHPEFKTPVGSFSSDIPPTINSRVIDSTVRLKDGETIILGGLIEEKSTVTHRKVPILGDIPLLKYLFRTKSKNNSKTEMMIFITPHVFYGDEMDSEKWRNLQQKYE
jgi:type IV pilus assembly protein PilQ